jgi:hypothetical protein
VLSTLLELERTLWRTGASDDDHRCAGAWSLNHEVCEAVTQGSAPRHWLLIPRKNREADEFLFQRGQERGGSSVIVQKLKFAALEDWATVLSAIAALLLLTALVFSPDSGKSAFMNENHKPMIIIPVRFDPLLELERTLWHTGASDDDHRCAGAWSLNHEVCEAVTQGSALSERFVGDFREQTDKNYSAFIRFSTGGSSDGANSSS